MSLAAFSFAMMVLITLVGMLFNGLSMKTYRTRAICSASFSANDARVRGAVNSVTADDMESRISLNNFSLDKKFHATDNILTFYFLLGYT